MGFYAGSIALDELLVLGLEASGEEAQRLGLIYPAQAADVMALLVQLDYRVSHIVQVRIGVYASGNGQAPVTLSRPAEMMPRSMVRTPEISYRAAESA